jgi:hypothetical protein
MLAMLLLHNPQDIVEEVLFTPLTGVFFALYVFPIIVGFFRRRPDWARIVVNLLLGWTVVGWFLAFAWATGMDEESGMPRA